MSLLWKTASDQADEYYHGTVRHFEPGEHILPPQEHGDRKTFPTESSSEHAYATTKPSDAWWYAETAWHGTQPHHTDFGNPPRVYRVRPMGPVEKDPERDEYGNLRSNFTHDVRSRHGFEVIGEEPMPEHMGDPEDWR